MLSATLPSFVFYGTCLVEPSREGGSTFLKLSLCYDVLNRQLCARYTGRTICV